MICGQTDHACLVSGSSGPRTPTCYVLEHNAVEKKENLISPPDRKKRTTYPDYHEDVQAIKEGRQHLGPSMRHRNAAYASDDGLPI